MITCTLSKFHGGINMMKNQNLFLPEVLWALVLYKFAELFKAGFAVGMECSTDPPLLDCRQNNANLRSLFYTCPKKVSTVEGKPWPDPRGRDIPRTFPIVLWIDFIGST